MIQQVERLRPELKSEALVDVQIANDPQIQVHESRTPHYASSGIAEPDAGWSNKRAGVLNHCLTLRCSAGSAPSAMRLGRAVVACGREIGIQGHAAASPELHDSRSRPLPNGPRRPQTGELGRESGSLHFELLNGVNHRLQGLCGGAVKANDAVLVIGAAVLTVSSVVVAPTVRLKFNSMRSCTAQANAGPFLRLETLFGDLDLIWPGTQRGSRVEAGVIW